MTIRAHRKGTRKAISERLVRHSEIAKRLEAEGLTREDASKEALRMINIQQLYHDAVVPSDTLEK